jgi:HK97 gp10 family phage protein
MAFENRAFKVEGLDELLQNMGDLQEEIGKKKTDRLWRKILAQAMAPVLETAKALAPVDSGQLKDHIYMKVQKPASRDKASLSYEGEGIMARVTVGPKRQDSKVAGVYVKRGKQKNLYNHRPVALAKEFGTADIAARPFMRPALAANVDNVIQRLGDAIWYELQWGKWTKKG